MCCPSLSLLLASRPNDNSGLYGCGIIRRTSLIAPALAFSYLCNNITAMYRNGGGITRACTIPALMGKSDLFLCK